VLFARVLPAFLSTLAARFGALAAMLMLVGVLFTLRRALFAEMRAQGAKIAVMSGMPCHRFQRGLTRIGTIETNQSALGHAFPDVMRGAVLAHMKALLARFNAALQFFVSLFFAHGFTSSLALNIPDNPDTGAVKIVNACRRACADARRLLCGCGRRHRCELLPLDYSRLR
jgi:hypothetical protein